MGANLLEGGTKFLPFSKVLPGVVPHLDSIYQHAQVHILFIATLCTPAVIKELWWPGVAESSLRVARLCEVSIPCIRWFLSMHDSCSSVQQSRW